MHSSQLLGLIGRALNPNHSATEELRKAQLIEAHCLSIPRNLSTSVEERRPWILWYSAVRQSRYFSHRLTKAKTHLRQIRH